MPVAGGEVDAILDARGHYSAFRIEVDVHRPPGCGYCLWQGRLRLPHDFKCQAFLGEGVVQTADQERIDSGGQIVRQVEGAVARAVICQSGVRVPGNGADLGSRISNSRGIVRHAARPKRETVSDR